MSDTSQNKKRMFLDVLDEDPSFDKLLSELGGHVEDFKLNLSKEHEELPKPIKPSTGLCVKTKEENDSKVFINLCHSPELPKPADITEKELSDILLSEEPSLYRVPLSLGEPHEEKAKDGSDCTCYDVIVNTEYFKSIQKNEFFRAFLISVCVEGIEEKYNIKLNKDIQIILQNKKYYGKMPQHFIRRKPLIAELGSKSNEVSQKPLVAEEGKKELEYLLWKSPASGHPKKITAKVFLPDVVTGSSVSLHVGEDRLILQDVKKEYQLDIFLPYLLLPEKAEAEFRLCDKILVVTLPVAPRLD